MSTPAPVPATRPPALMDTSTGEVLDLEALELARWTPDELAGLRDRLGEVKRMIDAVLVDVDAELVAELDRDNARTGRFGEWEVSAPAALETVWDMPALGLALEALVQAGKLTRSAAEATRKREVTYTARKRELTKLLGHADADVVEAVDACRRAVPRASRRATVKRATSAQPRLSAAHEPQEGTQ